MSNITGQYARHSHDRKLPKFFPHLKERPRSRETVRNAGTVRPVTSGSVLHTHMVWHFRVSLVKRPGPSGMLEHPRLAEEFPAAAKAGGAESSFRPAATSRPRGRASPAVPRGARARRKNSRTAKEPERQSTIRAPCLGILRPPFFTNVLII